MKHTKKITILHSNDLHGDFLAEQVDEKLVGGVSMLSGYIEKVRAEQPNTIYAIAGDMFRGSVIDSEYKGLSTIEIMNALAPDIVTIGNHEVDYGIAHLLFIEKCARFPIINANLYIKNTPTRLFTPYKILRVDGMNILFIGIITQDVINQTKSESLVGSFVDTAAAAAEVGKICNAHNSIDIDFTVLLTHIGFEEDRHLARQLDPAWGVDLIIGGHPHVVQPARVLMAEDGREVPVFYSLGNFLSHQTSPENMLGGMASVTIVKDADGTHVSEYDLQPTVNVILRNANTGWYTYRPMLLDSYSSDLAAQNRFSECTVDAMWALYEDITG